MLRYIKKEWRFRFFLIAVLYSICVMVSFLTLIYMYGNLLPTKQVPALFAENETSQLLEVALKSPLEPEESYLYTLDDFDVEQAYFVWETDFQIQVSGENLKVFAYRDNEGSGEIGKTVPADEQYDKGIIMPIEYQDSTVTLDGVTLDVVRNDHQAVDMAYMPMKNFLALDPPVKKIGFYFHGTSLMDNLDEIKEAAQKEFPNSNIYYYVPDTSELQYVERTIFPKYCAGEFVLLLVLCSIFYCVVNFFFLDSESLCAQKIGPLKWVLLCMVQGDIYLLATFLLSEALHAACYPIFDLYLNSVTNIKYVFGDYIIMLIVTLVEIVLIQFILFLPILCKQRPKLKEGGI